MIAPLSWLFIPHRPKPLTTYELLNHQLGLVHAEAQRRDKHRRAENRWIVKNRWAYFEIFIHQTRDKQNARDAEEQAQRLAAQTCTPEEDEAFDQMEARQNATHPTTEGSPE